MNTVADDADPDGKCNAAHKHNVCAANSISDQVLQDYKTMISRLYRYGVPVFLITGSFISQHRDCGGWNVNDHDLDLVIFAEDLYRLPICQCGLGCVDFPKTLS